MISTQKIKWKAFRMEENRNAHLVSRTSNTNYRIYDNFSVGRDRSSDIVINNPFISRQHARFLFREGQYYLRDLNSQNGTFVNGVRIKEIALCDQDLVRFGDLNLVFSTEEHLELSKIQQNSNNLSWATQLQSIPQIAYSQENVLLLGESGTGKEVISQWIHELSPRSKAPFVAINCSNFNHNLIESELFGHTKGSFTDATSDRKGAFLEADGGTLFLDEIGDMPLDLQAKLLRVLENRELRALGSDKTTKVDVRIVAATHKNLRELVSEGLFRMDLFYRLNIIQIQIPALRDRMEDFVPLLLNFAREHKVNFAQASIHKLATMDWPGNIRELKNFVRRSAALYPHQVIAPELLTNLLGEDENKVLELTERSSLSKVKQVEKHIIEQSLAQYQGNQRRAAQSIGMPKSTFYDKVRKYKIEVGHFFPTKEFYQGLATKSLK